MKTQTTLPQEPVTNSNSEHNLLISVLLPQSSISLSTNGAKDLYDGILWRILAQRAANETLAVGLAGCAAQSGTTTIATHLALQASEQLAGRVLLVDADWRPSGLNSTFRCGSQPGLYNILSGDVAPRECELLPVADHLDLLCQGNLHEDRPVHVQPRLAEELLAEYKSDYELILVDLPQANDLRSSLPLARALDGTLLVTRFESIKQSDAEHILELLDHDQVAVWGSLLNRHREYIPKWLRRWV